MYLLSLITYGILQKSTIKLFATNSVIGIIVLLTINLFSSYINVFVKVNYVSVVFSTLFGVPGLGLYLFIDKLFI